MDKSILFLYVVFLLSIGIYLAALAITAGFIMPLQLKLSGVKNGLIKLRKQMLLEGWLDVATATLWVITLTVRYIIPDQNILRYILVSMIFVQAVVLVARQINKAKIYKQDYTPKNIAKHARIDALEKKGLAI